ncbi:MAG: hypothetical protein RLZZ338_3605 [Cyanobacteriota bacterium]|jgi:hypothetical protein
MINTSITAKSMGIEVQKPVLPIDIYDRVVSAGVILVPNCLQLLEYFDELKEASLEGRCQVSGEKKAARINQKGCEAIHPIIDLEEITSVVNFISEGFNSLAQYFLMVLVKAIFQKHEYCFWEEDPNQRFDFPRKNQALNTEYGASPCHSLSKLSVFNNVQHHNQDTWEITSSCTQNQGGY